MTTSVKALAHCLGLSDEVSVRTKLLPRAESGRPGRPGIPLSGQVSLLKVMRYLEWQWCDGANYLKMPVPADLRSPSREEAQIAVDGVAEKVTLFMGKSDWELDWHIHPRLDEQVMTQLQAVGRLRGTLFCEWMGVDRWEDELLGRQWWSSDMDGILSLRWPLPDARSGAETASEHWSLVEDDNQGGSAEIVADINNTAKRGNARIVGGRVYLQGAFVMDDPNDTDDHAHLEIHPLDSVAYAMDGDGAVLAQRGTDTSWPRSTVVWRVGVITNAGFHRINGCGFLERDRTTVWYLDLPTLAGLPTISVRVDDSEPGFWHSPSNSRYTGRGIRDVDVQPRPDGSDRDISAFPIDPSDGRRKLRVEVTMARPDDWGGLFLRDYRMTARSVVAGADQPGAPPDLDIRLA
ncbi:MAG: hypothetical protein ABW364_00675 [Rhodococcus fascians]